MPDRVGANRETGAVATDWEHVKLCIQDILTTPIGSRVMLREYGSELFDLIDRPMTEQNILRCYAATYVAILRWEPGYRPTLFSIPQAGPDGRMRIMMGGIYYPRGHVGDFTPAKDGPHQIVVAFG